MGRPDFKHRDSVYQQICAQITREASDLSMLAGAASRALSHPDVCGDPGLASMVRGFISQCEAALRTKHRVEHPQPEDDSQLRRAFDEPEELQFPTRQQALAVFGRYQKDFEIQLAQYNEAAARYALEKLQAYAKRFPVHIDAAIVHKHEGEFEEFLQRVVTMRKEIDDVVRQVVGAAQQGDQKTAGWLLRRLRAIQALTPVLLPADRLAEVEQTVAQSSQQQEHREALQEVKARQQAVAEEIKKAAAAIYRFQKVSKIAPPESDEYQRAEKAYREAVIRVKVRDTEWLTGLLLELETFIEDLRDPGGLAQQQLDRFIGTVRTAMNQLRTVIREIQQERAAAEKARAEGQAGTQEQDASPAP